MNFNQIQALIADMDGVVWRGDTPLPGLNKLFNFLAAHNIPFTLATNNASKTVAQYQKKFARFGVEVQPENVMTSSIATAMYLKDTIEPGSNVYVVGEDGLTDAVRQAGFNVLDDAGQPAAAVAAGIDFTFTYEKLKYATLLIRRGAHFVGSNGDLTFPSEEGLYPGAGSILAAIEAATDTKPTVIGKPEPLMFNVAVRRMNSTPAHTVMIGDRLETDILGAQRAGMKTVLVTTGIDNQDSIASKGIQPDIILSGIDELVDVWQSQLDAK
ncbi:MAG: HAD-IIA family hydrolase [Anaerolineae bacterium]|nr:HAD-IIA family hydrolase [Anaerolineae bacterium]